MITIRRILCPIDFSEFADRAVRHATTLARWYGAEIHGLYVVPLLAEGWSVPLAVHAVPGDALVPTQLREALAARLAPAREAGVRTEVHVREGAAAHEIAEYAQRASIDLVVMGTHGRTGFPRLLLGSVAETVLRHAPCPVLTTCHAEPAPRPDGPPFRRILFAADLTPSCEPTLSVALSLAEEAGADLTLLHVAEPFFEDEIALHTHIPADHYRRFLANELEQRLVQAVPPAARDWCRPHEVVRIGTPWVQIVQVAKDCGAELIVMGLHSHRGAVDRIVFGSTAQQVLRHAESPVLTIGHVPASDQAAAVSAGVDRQA